MMMIYLTLLNSVVCTLPAIKVPFNFVFTFTLRTWTLFEQINGRINNGLTLGMC